MSRMTVMQELGKDVKGALTSLHETVSDAEDCVYLLQISFIYNSPIHLNDCRRKASGMLKTLGALKNEIETLSLEHPIVKPYISVPAYMTKATQDLERLADLVGKKIREQVLFSDKAVEEVTFLMQRLIDLLRPTADIILARNEILINYVRESETDVIRKALEYATFHEDRLIGGVCLPIASPLYLNMLDAIKSIAWNAKCIAVKLLE